MKLQTKKQSKLKNTNTKKNTKNNKLKIGCHISITPSILEGIHYGESIGANAFQIFMGSNQSASLKTKTKFEPNECNEIRNYVSRNNLTLIIHSIYLLNFCKFPATSGRIQYQHANIQYDLKNGALIGAKCVVLHIGFKNDLTEDEALNNLVSNINYIVKHMPEGISLALETSACRGTEMGCNLEQLSKLWKRIKHNNKTGKKDSRSNSHVGFVIDTAHIFSSGYDITNVTGITDYLTQFNKLIGLENICLFHINDSRYKLGERKDEHKGIGYGNIYNTPEGLQALKYIKTLCLKKKIPMILETHSAAKVDSEGTTNNKGYEYEIDLIKKL
jgi:deoxyribonuclease-4